MCIDATDPEKGNWLRYVNWACSGEEQNLFPLEINRAIYYKTLKVTVLVLIYSWLLCVHFSQCSLAVTDKNSSADLEWIVFEVAHLHTQSSVLNTWLLRSSICQGSRAGRLCWVIIDCIFLDTVNYGSCSPSPPLAQMHWGLSGRFLLLCSISIVVVCVNRKHTHSVECTWSFGLAFPFLCCIQDRI